MKEIKAGDRVAFTADFVRYARREEIVMSFKEEMLELNEQVEYFRDYKGTHICSV